MILLIDNYDSFVHNLARYFVRLGQETHVVRNDAITIEGVGEMAPDAIVLSPGPCGPAEAGCSLELVRAFWSTIPFLGVCLGHQAIGEAFGGTVTRAGQPWHGRSSEITHDGTSVFSGLPSPMSVGRYHSLSIAPESLPSELSVIARSADGEVMAIQHASRPVVGVQFHPESVLTENGPAMLVNFLRMAGIGAAAVSGPPEIVPPSPAETKSNASGTPVSF